MMKKREKIVPGNDPPSTNYTKEEEEDWKKVFDQFDLDGNGEIDFNEMKNVVSKSDYGGKVDEKSLQEVFNSVDIDGSGAIDFDEFKTMLINADDVKDSSGTMSMMNHKQPMSSNFFKECARQEALKQKKARLRQYSSLNMVKPEKAENQTNTDPSNDSKSAASQKPHVANLLGERSKLLWRTNTRLDIMIYEANKEVLIVQTSSKNPTVVYKLVYLKYKSIVEFVQSQSAEEPAKKQQTDTDKAKELSNMLCNYVVSRIQLEDSPMTSSQSAPVAGAAAAGKPAKIVTVQKLSADTEDEIVVDSDPIMYPVPELSIVENLSAKQWDEKMQEIADDIALASSNREKSNNSLNGMGFALDTLETLLNSVRFTRRKKVGKWAKAVIKMKNQGELEATMRRLSELKLT